MNLSLSGRKVVITGVGDGIGRALALAFAEAGAHVAGCARSQDRLDQLAQDISGEGHLFEATDVTLPEQVERFVSGVNKTLGGTDVLVNNVGSIGKLTTFMDLSDNDWEQAFQVNLLSAVRLCRLFIPILKGSTAPRIINVSSIAASRPGDIFPHYSAMKAGLSALTVSLATTLAPDGILVNTVSPGPVWTRSWENQAKGMAEATGQDPEQAAQGIRSSTAETVPLKRMGLPEDITGITLLLASDQASWITGSNFVVDGGVLRQPH